jgi:hypothetical protein
MWKRCEERGIRLFYVREEKLLIGEGTCFLVGRSAICNVLVGNDDVVAVASHLRQLDSELQRDKFHS